MSDKVIVTTSRGAEIECLPVAAMLETFEENVRNGIDWPAVPTYVVEYAGGTKIARPHDEASIADPKTTDKERQAWADYLLAKQAADARFAEKRGEGQMRLLAVEGVRVLNEPQDWQKRHEFYGMTVPTDPLERQVHYFRTEVVGTQDDIYLIMLGVYRASGYDEEVLSRVEASFRASLRQDNETGTGADTGDGAGDTKPKKRRRVVRKPDVDDDGHADTPGD